MAYFCVHESGLPGFWRLWTPNPGHQVNFSGTPKILRVWPFKWAMLERWSIASHRLSDGGHWTTIENHRDTMVGGPKNHRKTIEHYGCPNHSIQCQILNTFHQRIKLFATGFYKSLDILQSWDDPWSCSPSPYVMIFSTVVINAVICFDKSLKVFWVMWLTNRVFLVTIRVFWIIERVLWILNRVF